MTDPIVKLGSKEYTVKPLVWKQLRTVIPAFSRFKLKSQDLLKGNFDEAMMDDLSLIIYEAIKSSHSLTYDQFTDLPITQEEMLKALSVVAAQAGMTKVDGATGEDQKSATSS